MDGRERKNVRPGLEVEIVLKQDQRTGRLTRGVVRELLTRSAHHPHGIKVRLMQRSRARPRIKLERLVQPHLSGLDITELALASRQLILE